MTRRLRAVPDPPPHPHDLCADCGHTYGTHRGGGACLAYRPAGRLKSVDYDADPIELATQLAAATNKSKAQAHAYTSSVCACLGFRASGYRFIPENDAEDRLRVAEGRQRRNVQPVA